MRQLGAAGPDRPRQQSPACWRSVNPLSSRARSIAPPLGPPGRAIELSTGTGAVPCTDTVRVGLPSVVWLRGLDVLSPLRA